MFLVFPDPRSIAHYVSQLLADRIRANPQIVLGLATGGTMEPVYARFIELATENQLDVSQVRSFNLDEYVGLPADHPQSYAAYMQTHLFSRLPFNPLHCHVPDGLAPDLDAHCHDYSMRIQQSGGIDLQLLGVGGNGHIGFNEPGTPFDSRCHVMTLSERTRVDNSRFFARDELVPAKAITMGLQDIMDAREIILIATGPHKASTLAKYYHNDVTETVPFTILKRHPRARLIVDEQAAARLPAHVCHYPEELAVRP